MKYTTSWWLNQAIFKKMLVKLDHFPQNTGWKLKNVWNHHLD